jgi:HTH-type transcriptional regulator/antitoxin HigA
MNMKDVAAHWVALHEQLGLGAPIADEAEYERALMVVDQLVEATQEDDAHPLWGLVSVAGERIRAYEERVHPWLDTSTPASALMSLMQEHGLRQGNLPEVGSQGVVSEVLSGKRQLNARQISGLARRFCVPADVFLP